MPIKVAPEGTIYYVKSLIVAVRLFGSSTPDVRPGQMRLLVAGDVQNDDIVAQTYAPRTKLYLILEKRGGGSDSEEGSDTSALHSTRKVSF